jgi:hypothetical protein
MDQYYNIPRDGASISVQQLHINLKNYHKNSFPGSGKALKMQTETNNSIDLA